MSNQLPIGRPATPTDKGCSCTCVQVVSMDGTLISKGGVMTGGMSRNLESRAQRWDEKATGSLKEVTCRTITSS